VGEAIGSGIQGPLLMLQPTTVVRFAAGSVVVVLPYVVAVPDESVKIKPASSNAKVYGFGGAASHPVRL
jgi:hypothetical protein